MPAERQSQQVVVSDAGAWAVGSVISGKFEVLRVLGQGAMGVVVAARHLELDETVAIKFIHPEAQSVPDIVSRFAREAKACARLGSEHIAKVMDVGVAPGIGPYIVMEYLEGQDLGSALRKRGALPVHRACEYVMQVCEALALAHAAGIIHRDVKPDNLFLTRRGNLDIIKVLDFGISKTPLGGRAFGGEVRVTETACLMGTPLYMSPEQIRATHEVDHRSDIWSLGVVLFELLTGRTAFAGETLTQVCALVLEGEAPRLAEHCRSAPNGLAAVIERCLMKDPALRYQTAAELAHALLPFAPSRARLHAERASSVLRRDSATLAALGERDSGPVAAKATPPAPRAAEPIVTGALVGRVRRLVARAGGWWVLAIAAGAPTAVALTFMVLALASSAPAPPLTIIPTPASGRPGPKIAPPIRVSPLPPRVAATGSGSPALAGAAPPMTAARAPAVEPHPRDSVVPHARPPRRSAPKLAHLHQTATPAIGLGRDAARAATDRTTPPATEPAPLEPAAKPSTGAPKRARLLDTPTRARLVE
jgi:serine/threonine-protein kinase